MSIHNDDLYGRRRAAMFDAMAEKDPKGIAIFSASPVFARNSDVDHDYRQDSDFFYLTGFSEPESVAVLTADDRKFCLFLRPRDPEREIWDGPRAGVDGAKQRFSADEAYNVRELDDRLPGLLQNRTRLHYRLGSDRAFDDRIFSSLARVRARARLGVDYPREIVDPGIALHEMRLIKGEPELAAMRRAAEITGEAHLRAMAAAKPGMHEYEVEGLLLETFRRNGAERPAYGSIVGSGPNATILHYRQNDRRMQDGELLLIDAGCEYDYFASDVTRTFPVNGRFSAPQQAVYEVVLEAQLAGIAETKVGVTLERVHQRTVEVLTQGLVRIGLLKGEPDSLIEKEAYKAFYMHRTSHWLGMDVHDVGRYFLAGKPRTLQPGMVLTVEPGIYIASNNESVGPEWRGIGVRIEDDILVSSNGPVNMTSHIPKTVADVIRACGR